MRPLVFRIIQSYMKSSYVDDVVRAILVDTIGFRKPGWCRNYFFWFHCPMNPRNFVGRYVMINNGFATEDGLQGDGISWLYVQCVYSVMAVQVWTLNLHDRWDLKEGNAPRFMELCSCPCMLSWGSYYLLVILIVEKLSPSLVMQEWFSPLVSSPWPCPNLSLQCHA